MLMRVVHDNSIGFGNTPTCHAFKLTLMSLHTRYMLPFNAHH